MRLTCEASVIDQNQPQNKTRLLKSIISIGYHKQSQENAEMFLLHENLLKKSGQRYRIKLNVLKVFTKFLNEGKATISFKEPPHNLLIQCDKIRLSAFLRSLNLGLVDHSNINKSQASQSNKNARKLPQLVEAPFSVKNHVNRKMNMKNRSDLDKGIPRTVEDLTISALGLYRFPTSILRLQNLSTLNLSENNLTEIPTGLGLLPLADVNFAQNQLGNSNFGWLSNICIQMTLKSINLSDNKLRHFPANFFKLPNLNIMKLNNNQIERIPFAIRALKNLRELYIDKNKLESLPDALRWISFDIVDISDNPFKPIHAVSKQDMINRVCVQPNINLTEMCMRRVIQYKLPYTPATLPRSLIELLEVSPLCMCGSICFAMPIIERWHEAQLVSRNIVKTNQLSAYGDGTLCSQKCVRRYLSLMVTLVQFNSEMTTLQLNPTRQEEDDRVTD